MNPEIKLKRLCSKGLSAKIIQRFIKDRKQVLSVFDQAGDCLMGEINNTPRHPIEIEAGRIIGWVSGEQLDAELLAALIGYMAQKELESKLLAQETLSKYKELTLLYELGEKIADCMDIDQLAELTLNEAQQLLSSGKDLQLAILLTDEIEGQLSVCAGRGDMFPVGATLCSIDGITQEVLSSGVAEIVNDVKEDSRYQECPGILSDIASLLCTPLKTRDAIFGVLSVVSLTSINFSAADAKVLGVLASQVAIAIGRVHLIHERVAQERFQESLELSRSIQMSMLPTEFPRFSQGSVIDLFAYIQPAREVGGDFYDFFHLNEKTLLVVIGDVSGKGVPAALFMVMVKTLIRAMANQYVLPDRILAALNPEICRDNDAMMFVTLFIATLDLETKLIKYSYGGHNRPLYLSKYGIVSMLPGDSGTALGIFEDATFSMESMQLDSGDSLILYTDGINEAMSVDYEEYGDERLCGLLVGLDHLNAQELLETVSADVNVFTTGAEQSDDITLLTLQMS